MDDDQIDRNIKFAQSVARAYGYETVSSTATYEAFAAHSKLPDRGFVQTAPGMFCREAASSLVHVVKLLAMKGGAYQPVWGASLAFMPHTWKPKAKFHRTLKAARLDLFERPGPSKRATRELWEIGSISTLHGDGYMRATLMSMWADTEASIVDWFSRADDLGGCLAIARDQCLSSDWTYATHFPNPKLVHAFLLAKLGRVEEGKTELAAYCADREDGASFAELERALAQV